jgi:hypothetical protein
MLNLVLVVCVYAVIVLVGGAADIVVTAAAFVV